MAFVIAHLSPELLEHNQFYPQILVENAQFIYERDADLPYVELIEEGQAGIDDDYWTTARYQIEDEDGQRLETTLEPDVYYWYLVHPRMEDEYPFYIDGWASCSGAECASNPEDGQFWREFYERGARRMPEDRMSRHRRLCDHRRSHVEVQKLRSLRQRCHRRADQLGEGRHQLWCWR